MEPRSSGSKRRINYHATILVCDDDKQIVEAIDIYPDRRRLSGESRLMMARALELLENNSVDLMIVV